MAFIRRCVLVLGIGAMSACASTPSAGPPPDPSTPRDPERVPTPVLPATVPTSFTYSGGTSVYDLDQLTTLAVGPDTVAAPAGDTVRTSAQLTLSLSMSSSIPTGIITVDSLMIASVRDTTAPVRQLTAPVIIQLPSVPGPIASPFDSTAVSATCDSMEEAARVLASDIHMEIPVPLMTGQTWSDSATTMICRGGIPLTAIRVSRFQVGEIRNTRDSSLAIVDRQSGLTISGSGTQGNRRITVRGEGTSETRFTYDLRLGRLLESQGQSVLRLAFETIQQTEQVVQRSTSRIRIRP